MFEFILGANFLRDSMIAAIEPDQGEQRTEKVQQMQVAEAPVSLAESVFVQCSGRQHTDVA